MTQKTMPMAVNRPHDFHNKLDCTVNIFGIPVFSGGKSEVLRKMMVQWGTAGHQRPLVVLTPTTEQVVMAQSDDILSNSFRRADINVPDSAGLILADRVWAAGSGSRWRLRERVTGIDLAETLCAAAAKEGRIVYVVGGKSDTAERSAAKLCQRFGGLRITGEEGIHNVAEEQAGESARLIRRINDSGASVLLVGFGAPWQERWVTQHAAELRVDVVMVVGGAIDVWAGNIRRAPVGWRKIGLEWLWRLLQEPWRWRRQLRLVQFLGMVGLSLVRRSDRR